jgi:broad specificity phosphatase PhoE
MGQYYFIRHGESEANRGAWLAGHRDSPLTERGREQARQAFHQVQALDVQAVLVSDLARAVETAQIVLKGRELPIRQTPLLRERAGGQWEGRQIEELLAAGHLQKIRGWYAQPPGGESLHQVALRAFRAIEEQGEGHNVLIVAHGALIRAVLHAVDRGPGGEISDQAVDNAEVVQRFMPAGGWANLRARCEAHAEAQRGVV